MLVLLILSVFQQTLNNTDTLYAGLQTYIHQSKYDAYKCPKYMIEGQFSINFTLNNFHNTISLNLLKNDSYCNEKLYKSIKIESCNLENYNECIQFRAKCFESKCCDNDADYLIDSIFVNNKNYEAYIFSFEKEYSKIKEVFFVKNLGFVKITDFDNNEMVLNIADNKCFN